MTAGALAVAAIAILTFRETLGHGFVSWDDDVYVYANPAFTPLSLQSIGTLVTSFYYYAYIPVTLLSHAADVLAWGMNPQRHHLTNVVLHGANAVWILILGVRLLSFTRRAASTVPTRNPGSTILGMGLAAVLFAVHPLRAETVSWISDRKDLLCAFFSLPAAMAYLVYSERRGAGRSRRWLAVSFLLFVLAVLSKATAVVFPIVLLLLDWLLGRKDNGRFLEKAPFVIVGAIVGAVTLAWSPHSAPAYAAANLTRVEGLLFPFYCLSFPLYKTLAPFHLGPIYPRVGLEWMIAGLAVVAAATTAGTLLAGKGRRGPLVALLVYLLFLIPNVTGLASGAQPVADRYSYLSTISLYLLLGAGIVAAWDRGGRARRATIALGAGLLAIVLAGVTIPQAARWQSSISLWESVVAKSPAKRDYADAYLNLGVAYEEAGRRVEALGVLGKAVALDPENPKILHNLGMISYHGGRLQEALDYFRRACDVDPRPAMAYFNRALVSEQLGLYDEALASMVRAARLGSQDAQGALNSRGIPWQGGGP